MPSFLINGNDNIGFPNKADEIIYNNTTTGLGTGNVQSAIDSLSNSLANLIAYEEFEYSQRTISASSSSIIALTNIEKSGYNIISITPFVYSTRNRVTCSMGVNTDSTWSIESNVPLVTLKNNATTQENATLKVKVVYKKI